MYMYVAINIPRKKRKKDSDPLPLAPYFFSFFFFPYYPSSSTLSPWKRSTIVFQNITIQAGHLDI